MNPAFFSESNNGYILSYLLFRVIITITDHRPRQQGRIQFGFDQFQSNCMIIVDIRSYPKISVLVKIEVCDNLTRSNTDNGFSLREKLILFFHFMKKCLDRM